MGPNNPSPSSEIARCRKEQAEIYRRIETEQHPAWIVMLALEDWEMEIRIIEEEA